MTCKHNYTEHEPCPYCADEVREALVGALVSVGKDIAARIDGKLDNLSENELLLGFMIEINTAIAKEQ